MTHEIVPIVMPKWGLAMTEGQLTAWKIEEGTEIGPGVEIAEIETTKITNVFEAPVSGHLRKLVASEGETLPVGALLAVIADKSVSDADVDAYVTEFQANFVPKRMAETMRRRRRRSRSAAVRSPTLAWVRRTATSCS